MINKNVLFSLFNELQALQHKADLGDLKLSEVNRIDAIIAQLKTQSKPRTKFRSNVSTTTQLQTYKNGVK